MSNSVQPHRRQPTRLPRPWNSPGKNTGVGCHFLLQCMKVKGESEVTQSCLTLSDPMDCSLPGPAVQGIFQERVLELGCHYLLCLCASQITSVSTLTPYCCLFQIPEKGETLIGLTLLVGPGHIKDPGYTGQVCTHIPVTYGPKSLGYKTWLAVFIPLRGDVSEERRMWLVGLNDICSLRKFMEGLLQQWQTL